MIQTLTTMPRTKKPKRNVVSIKIEADILPIAKAIIGLEDNDQDLIDLFSESLRPVLKERFAKAVKEANKRLDEPKKPAS